jgi:hypothetical protein
MNSEVSSTSAQASAGGTPETSGRRSNVYEEIAAGLRGYYYPVTWSRRLGRWPMPVRILDQNVVLIRDQGRVYALLDRCPHRRVPLSAGRRRDPGPGQLSGARCWNTPTFGSAAREDAASRSWPIISLVGHGLM